MKNRYLCGGTCIFKCVDELGGELQLELMGFDMGLKSILNPMEFHAGVWYGESYVKKALILIEDTFWYKNF